MSCGSTHIFPFAGPIDPQCSICRKTKSQIQQEDWDASVARVEAVEREMERDRLRERAQQMLRSYRVRGDHDAQRVVEIALAALKEV